MNGMIDWADPKRTDVIHFVMVDPNNLDNAYGDIDDVQLGSSTITYGYYTDTRYSSRITFLKDNNYVRNAWIRIVHEVPAEGYSNELGTFVPTSPDVQYNGAVMESYTLQSPLWAMMNDLTTASFSIGKGTSFVSAFERVCDTCKRPYILQNPNDWMAQQAVVYEAGTSYFDIISDIASATNNNIELDGHGRITLSPLSDMRYLSPSWDIDADSSRSIVIQGSIRMEPDAEEIPNRIIVVGGAYVGVADLPDGSEYSAAQRGYVKAEKYSGSGVKDSAQAKSLAKAYLDSYAKVTQWSMTTLYFPAKCGENVRFTLDGKKHICMIQSIDPVDLDTMTMKITLREVTDG